MAVSRLANFLSGGASTAASEAHPLINQTCNSWRYTTLRFESAQIQTPGVSDYVGHIRMTGILFLGRQLDERN